MKALSVTALALSTLVLLPAHALVHAKTMQSTHARHITVTPRQIKWMDTPPVIPAGAKLAMLEGDPGKAGPLTLRIKFPANYKLAPHSHPDTERITVLSGEFHVGNGNRFNKAKAITLPAGGYAVLPQGAHHFAWTTRETVVQINGTGPFGITYVNPNDDPRNKS